LAENEDFVEEAQMILEYFPDDNLNTKNLKRIFKKWEISIRY